ncbi:Hypothetical protein, putative [Bodo saltans]|uniref:Leucine-rich repeat protein n=1 Tax=Bodo saltans TaxID=75058 RepID=A0A0S4JBD8_BODSA|nr:Hypothetical protein, putative [Bodo saltans]|eukprot:CUG87679.1 Hypothetical protein, putative [Bodo saltans]
MQGRIDDICAQLQANTLTAVDLTGSKFGTFTDDHMRQLAPYLRHNSSLESLNVSLNRISDDGVSAIARALGQNEQCRVTSVNISANSSVTDESVLELVRLLPSSVVSLDVSGCTLTSRSLTALVAKITDDEEGQQPSSLRSLEARDVQQLGDELWGTLEQPSLFAAYLSSPICELTTLHLSGNSFSNASVPLIAWVVEQNTSLTAFGVANSAFVTDYSPLAKALERNHQLVVYFLGGDGKKWENIHLEAKLRDNRRRRTASSHANKILALETAQDVATRKLKRTHDDQVRALQSQVDALQAEVEYWRAQATLALDTGARAAPAANGVNPEPLEAAD